ncbi:MAG: hypothetical protein ACKOEO_01445 [Planctomycetaceae bacterium]
MNASLITRQTILHLAGLSVACLVCVAVASSDEPPPRALVPPGSGDLNDLSAHPHTPLVVRSRPVIERLPVQVIEPVDLQVAQSGHIYVADSRAQCIFRLDSFSRVSLHSRDLAGLRRICLDSDESVYALTASTGECSIHQITPEGRKLLLHTLPFPAQSFARYGTTDWLVAEGSNIWSVNSDAERSLIFRSSVAVLDLCTDAGGGIAALLSDGQVLKMGSAGNAQLAGFAPGSPKRLICRSDGQLIVLADASLSRNGAAAPLPRGLYSLSNTAPNTEPNAIAHLPEGTEAAGFDSLGNLCHANPQLRAVTKVTSRFRIPCPHCRETVLMIFDANAQPDNIGGF